MSFKYISYGCFETVNNKEPVLKFYQCIKCIILIEIDLHFCNGELQFTAAN